MGGWDGTAFRMWDRKFDISPCDENSTVCKPLMAQVEGEPTLIAKAEGGCENHGTRQAPACPLTARF